MTRMRSLRTAPTAAALAVALVVAAAPAAFAGVSKDGTQYCGPVEQPRVQARAFGHFHVKGPGGDYEHYDSGGIWVTRYDGGPGGYWRVYVPGDDYGGISNANTYSYCLYI